MGYRVSDAYDPEGRRYRKPYNWENDDLFSLTASKELLVRNWARRIPVADEDIRWEVLSRYDVDSSIAAAIMGEWAV